MRPLHRHTPEAADDAYTTWGAAGEPAEPGRDERLPPMRARCPNCIRCGHLWGCSALTCDGGFVQ